VSPVIADGICSIGVFARQVTLGYTRGAKLQDPVGILQGGGTLIRRSSIPHVWPFV
jgi:hypothetical protein